MLNLHKKRIRDTNLKEQSKIKSGICSNLATNKRLEVESRDLILERSLPLQINVEKYKNSPKNGKKMTNELQSTNLSHKFATNNEITRKGDLF